MIGLIVTGHGHFATGLLSAAEVIAGKQEKVIGIDFLSEDSSEGLQKKIADALKALDCSSVLVLTDISGGTPFNQSVILASQSAFPCKVISGSNMPALLEAIFGRASDDVEALTQALITSEQVKLQLYADKIKSRRAQGQGGI